MESKFPFKPSAIKARSAALLACGLAATLIPVKALADTWNTGTAGTISSNSGSKIGIGTTAPNSLNGKQQVLEISGAGVVTPTANQGLPGLVFRGGSFFTGNPTWEFMLSPNGTNTNFQLVSGTSGRIFVNGASGNVGIGTTAANAKLDVNGNLNVANRATLTGNTAGQEALVVTQAQATGAIADFRSATGSKLTIDNGGKVGIGIVAPTARLDIQDATGNTPVILNSNLSYGTGVSGSYAAHSMSAAYGTGSTGTLTGLKVSVSNAGTGGTNAAVFVGGKVGIGTATPATALDVKGEARVTDGTNGILSFLGDSEGARITTAKLLGGTRDLRFINRDAAGAESEQLRITSNGKFGIGTQSPAARFDIQDASGSTQTLLNTNLAYGSGVSGSYPAHFMNASYGTGSTGTLTGLKVAVSNAGTGGTYAAVFVGGKVGIGNTAPVSTLDVTGTLGVSNQTILTGNVGGQEALIVNQTQAAGAIADFRKGNASKVTIDNGGKVGIGIVAPTARLDIQDVSGNTAVIFNSNLSYGTGVSGSYTAHSMSAAYGTGSTGTLTGLNVSVSNAGTGGTNAAVFVGGKVGIGTATPATTLDVKGEARVTDGVNGLLSFLGDSEGGRITIGKLQGGTRDLRFINREPTGAESEQLRITSNGRVGIGTQNPTARFDIQDVSGNTPVIFNSNLSYGTGVSGSYAAHSMSAAYGASSSGALTGLKVAVSNAGTGGTYAAVFVGGNVGVGTTAPTRTLDVNGSANITGNLKVASITTTVWSIAPDYVFEKDYKLATLDQVREYVDEHKHLPEIPSAKEIKEKGIDLAEMNMKLLRKVEELTLYSIQQQNEIKGLHNRMRKLEGRR